MRFPEKHKSLLPGDTNNTCRLELIIRGSERIVERRFCSGYLSVSKPLYPEGVDLPHFILINTSGGLVQGDRLAVRAELKKEARAHLTTQAANRIYRMEGGCAVQETSLAAGENSFLEYMPDQNIPYKGSNLFQLTTVDLASDSTFFGWDIVHPGRYASGEMFEMGTYYSRLELRVGGRPALVDTVVLEPEKRGIKAPGILAGASFIGTVYIYCREAEALRKALEVPCCLNHAGVLVVRLTGDDWPGMQKRLIGVHELFREHQHMPRLINRRG